MIIVNTTFVIDKTHRETILSWIRESYIKSSEKFSLSGSQPVITRILTNQDPVSDSYAVHLYFDDIESARRWNEGVAASLREIMSRRWGDKALAFSTMLETID